MLFVIACFLIWSCNQHPVKTAEKQPVEGRDTLGDRKPVKNSGDAIDIDAVKASPDKFKIRLENEYVRVVEYSLRPGEKDVPHTHPPKTSYTIAGGRLRVYPENEKPFEVEEVTGTSEWSGKRGKHYVENIGNTTVTILLTEVKGAQ